MATVTLKGNKLNTAGTIPPVGTAAPEFNLLATDLSEKSLADFKGKRVILNIFPSIDTDTCATSVRNFNKRASELDNTEVLCISRDTPFAQQRFATDEKIENVHNLSDVRDGKFGQDYGLTFTDGPLKDFHSRVVVVVDEHGKVIYNEQVQEIVDEPNYLAALKSLL